MADMYMRNIRDWRDATLMLSFEEKGYFDELLNLIYIYDDCLPDNDEFICRAMPVNKKFHLRLKKKLLNARLIQVKDGFYFNKRASEEVLKINKISENNRKNALNRWAKSRKYKDKVNATADADVVQNNMRGGKIADAGDMLNLNSESESILKTKAKNTRNNDGKGQTDKSKKCPIENVLDPDADIPEKYRNFAESQGLQEIERTFESWANWWVSEDGRKAGDHGWFTTWKARVRKDVERTKSQHTHQNGRGSGLAGSATTNGARLALHRRRNRKRKIQMEK